MNYVTLQLALTLDGYIARKDGSVDFLDDINSSFKDEFEKFINSVNTIIMGRGTYEKMLKFGEIPFKDKKIYVLTSKKLQSNKKNIEFTDKSIEQLLEELNDKIWLFGGSKVIQSFMNLDLIDEYQLYIVPKVIGEGIPLFLKNNGLSNLKLIKHEQFSNDVLLVYKKLEE
jgi:dihydrofolate reductase